MSSFDKIQKIAKIGKNHYYDKTIKPFKSLYGVPHIWTDDVIKRYL